MYQIFRSDHQIARVMFYCLATSRALYFASPVPLCPIVSSVSGPVPLNYGRQIRDPSDCPPVLFGVNTRKKVVRFAVV
ncbi:hypothetical protein D9611_012854 [Ephemerocybe angulata]|uniref:Uncharacterized protein n=1 Tax=Ephemerocybe angulata TaxID=980116 RepID=A0A8H5BAT0_9AGAR|nr:hypothetical protein D9611_012854 [Tulosesus angulatus]